MTLNPGHVDELQRSGLTNDTIARTGCYSATESGVRDLLGFGAGPGLVFPYPELNGSGPYARVKLDHTPRDGKRYRSPSGRPNRLYIPPLLAPTVLDDAQTPLWLTEGEKKALKACQEGLPCVAVPGVWSWKTRGTDGRSVAIPDLEHVVWRGRSVFIVYDSDVATKSKVRLAEYALAQELQRRGATVKAIRLPGGLQGEKVGLDDYLLTHSVETLCALEPIDIMDLGDERASPSPRDGELRREGLDLALIWPDGVRFRLTAIRDGRDGVRGELIVTREDRRLHWGAWSLVSTQAREGLRKKLEAVAPRVPWGTYLEEAAWRLTQAAREGEPLVRLTGTLRAHARELVPRFLYAGEPTLLYADGDTGKSLTALTLAVAVQTGVALPGGLTPARAVPAAYLDWETSRDTIEGRLARVAAGFGITPPPILYKHMTRSLVDEAAALAAEFARQGIGFVVIDSMMFAVAGSDGSAFHEPITAFFGALRLFGSAATLILSHVTNSDARSGIAPRPFGGAFAFNGPRLVWEATRDRDWLDGTALVLTCRKANNLVRRPDPIGLRFVADGDRTTLGHWDLAEAAPPAMGGAGLTYRLRLALAREAKHVEALAEELETGAATVRKALHRGRRQGGRGVFVQLEGTRPPLWALAAGCAP